MIGHNKNRNRIRADNISQFDFMEIPNDLIPSVDIDDVTDDDDDDLEAELAALARDGSEGDSKKFERNLKSKSKLIPSKLLDNIASDNIQIVNDNSDDDNENDDPENDEDLIKELQLIAGSETLQKVEPNMGDSELPIISTSDTNTINIIHARIAMYKQAEINAIASNMAAAKVRRLNRGLKTLKELLSKAKSGQIINNDDIPPEVSVNLSVPTSSSSQLSPSSTTLVAVPETNSTPAMTENDLAESQKDSSPNINVYESSSTDKPSIDSKILMQLKSRQLEYKMAALQSKRSGDTSTAIEFIKVIKAFDTIIKMYEDGQSVDLSDMPPSPNDFKAFKESIQAQSNKSTNDQKLKEEDVSVDESREFTGNENILDALQARLNKYKSVEETAKYEGNASKARRFGRIVKQYEEAIRDYQTKRVVAFDELPIPPGFGPLPIKDMGPTNEPLPKDKDSESNTMTNKTDGFSESKSNKRFINTPVKTSLVDQQKKILIERQKEFKLAALQAKKAGEIEQAKEYLKISKGFDSLITAAKHGLLVDLNTLPVQPSQRDNLEASFAIIRTEDCDSNDDMTDIRIRVEEQLVKQLMMCKNTRDHHKAMGDVAGMNRFENLALVVQNDLDVVRYSKREMFSLPKFHYEKRNFNIVCCNTDLTDNELEIVVVRGINYNVSNPKDVDTYVKIECPLPNDAYFRAKTVLVRDTDNPDYDQRFKVDIVRSSRQYQRLFKRHAIKFEVYSRGGFLRSDSLIGTVMIKLQPLETKCDIHNTFDLMEGRKVIGGKLEVKLRLRNPIIRKQLEHIEERWLALDS